MAGSLDALRDTRREWMINRSRLIASVLAIIVVLGVLVSLLLAADCPAR